MLKCGAGSHGWVQYKRWGVPFQSRQWFFVCLLPPKLLSPDFPILLVVLIIDIFHTLQFTKNRQDAAYPSVN